MNSGATHPLLSLPGDVPQTVVNAVNTCLKELRKKGSIQGDGGALNDLVVAMILKKNAIVHRLVYGFLISDEKIESKKSAMLTLTTLIGDQLVSWPGFTMHAFSSLTDEKTLVNRVADGKLPVSNPEDTIESVRTTFARAVEQEGQIVIPQDNYEDLLGCYLTDHALRHVVKQLRRDGYF